MENLEIKHDHDKQTKNFTKRNEQPSTTEAHLKMKFIYQLEYFPVPVYE